MQDVSASEFNKSDTSLSSALSDSEDEYVPEKPRKFVCRASPRKKVQKASSPEQDSRLHYSEMGEYTRVQESGKLPKFALFDNEPAPINKLIVMKKTTESSREVEKYTVDEEVSMWRFVLKQLKFPRDNHPIKRFWERYRKESGSKRSISSLEGHYRTGMVKSLPTLPMSSEEILEIVRLLPIPIKKEQAKIIEENFNVDIRLNGKTIEKWRKKGTTTWFQHIPALQNDVFEAVRQEKNSDDIGEDDVGASEEPTADTANYRKKCELEGRTMERQKYSVNDHKIVWSYIYRELRIDPEVDVYKFSFWRRFVIVTRSNRGAANVNCHFARIMVHKLFKAQVPPKMLFELYVMLGLTIDSSEEDFLVKKYEVDLNLNEERKLVSYKFLSGNHDEDIDEMARRVVEKGFAPPKPGQKTIERPVKVEKVGEEDPWWARNDIEDITPVHVANATNSVDALLAKYQRQVDAVQSKEKEDILVVKETEGVRREVKTEIEDDCPYVEPATDLEEKEEEKEEDKKVLGRFSEVEEAQMLKYLHKLLATRRRINVVNPASAATWGKLIAFSDINASVEEIAEHVTKSLLPRTYKSNLSPVLILQLYQWLKLPVNASLEERLKIMFPTEMVFSNGFLESFVEKGLKKKRNSRVEDQFLKQIKADPDSEPGIKQPPRKRKKKNEKTTEKEEEIVTVAVIERPVIVKEEPEDVEAEDIVEVGVFERPIKVEVEDVKSEPEDCEELEEEPERPKRPFGEFLSHVADALVAAVIYGEKKWENEGIEECDHTYNESIPNNLRYEMQKELKKVSHRDFPTWKNEAIGQGCSTIERVCYEQANGPEDYRLRCLEAICYIRNRLQLE